MKISRKSWHYRFLMNVMGCPYPPSNLCIYFWLVMGLLIVSPIAYPLFKFFDYLDNREPRPYKKPGLVRSYLKARKEKVCPLLEFED